MPVTRCLLCGSRELAPAIDLGFHPLADTFLKKEQLREPETRYPLRAALCAACGHLMNDYQVAPEKRYQENDYSYDSANSEVAVRHFEELAREVIEKAGIAKGDLVVDIGSSVGTLLSAFADQASAAVLGVEPAPNIAALARERGVETVQDFFGEAAARAILKKGKAKVVIATNVFNHISDPDACMQHVLSVLDRKGLFVIEVPYLLPLIQKTAFDTMYLEHVSYFAVQPLERYFKRFGLFIQDLRETDYMGGSLRVYAGFEPSDGSATRDFAQREAEAHIFEIETYRALQDRIRAFKVSLLEELFSAKRSGGLVAGIGAATKGNTLLNVCGIDGTLLEFVTDASLLKIGKFTPGSHLPILADDAITKEISHALILPWNIGEFLKKKLAPKHPHLTFIIPHVTL